MEQKPWSRENAKRLLQAAPLVILSQRHETKESEAGNNVSCVCSELRRPRPHDEDNAVETPTKKRTNVVCSRSPRIVNDAHTPKQVLVSKITPF
jgi:hypothetical protein